MAKYLGMGGSITVGALTVPVSEWSISVSDDTQETTDTGSGGWVSRLSGVNSAEVTFRAFWDDTGALLSTTFNIGVTVTAVLAIGASGDNISFPGIVSAFTITNNAKTPIEFQGTILSNGAPTFPT